MKKRSLLLVTILIIVVSALVILLAVQKKKITSEQPTTTTNQTTNNNSQNSQESQPEKVENIETAKGVLVESDFSYVKIELSDGQEKKLNITEEAQPVFLGIDKEFSQNTDQQEEETFYKEVGLFDIPVKSRVLVEYDSATNNLKKMVEEEE